MKGAMGTAFEAAAPPASSLCAKACIRLADGAMWSRLWALGLGRGGGCVFCGCLLRFSHGVHGFAFMTCAPPVQRVRGAARPPPVPHQVVLRVPTRWHSQLLGEGRWDSLGAWVGVGVIHV